MWDKGEFTVSRAVLIDLCSGFRDVNQPSAPFVTVEDKSRQLLGERFPKRHQPNPLRYVLLRSAGVLLESSMSLEQSRPDDQREIELHAPMGRLSKNRIWFLSSYPRHLGKSGGIRLAQPRHEQLHGGASAMPPLHPAHIEPAPYPGSGKRTTAARSRIRHWCSRIRTTALCLTRIGLE